MAGRERTVHPTNQRLIDEYRAVAERFRLDARRTVLLELKRDFLVEAERFDKLADELSAEK